MAFKTKRCRMVNPATGERCRQPSLRGKEYCRFHVQAGEAGLEVSAEMLEGRDSGREVDDARVSTADGPDASGVTPALGGNIQAPSPSGKPKRGARPSNRNARRHGLFSTRMPSDEKELYEENKRLFAEQAGVTNAFDELVVHLLALVAAKLDMAAANGASPQSIIPLSNEVLRLLRSLKETRDSRDEEEAGAPKTFADFLAEAEGLAEAQGVPAVEEETRGQVAELEKEVNELRRQLNLPQQEDIAHRRTTCARCGKETPQRLNLAGEWTCLACGVAAGPMSMSPGAAPAGGPSSPAAGAASRAVPAPRPAPLDEPKPSSSWVAIPPPPRNE